MAPLNSRRVLPLYRSLITVSQSLRVLSPIPASPQPTSYTEPARSPWLTRHLQSRPYSSYETPPSKSIKSETPPKEPPPTDFAEMDIFGNVTPPQTAVDSCLQNGFVLTDGTRVEGSGLILAGGQAFKWTPWLSGSNAEKQRLLNAAGQWEVQKDAFGIFDLLWPKPDLLILGTGAKTQFLWPATRKAIHEMGIRVEVMDTRNAAAQYNLLVTERGLNEVAAALVPLGQS